MADRALGVSRSVGSLKGRHAVRSWEKAAPPPCATEIPVGIVLTASVRNVCSLRNITSDFRICLDIGCNSNQVWRMRPSFAPQPSDR